MKAHPSCIINGHDAGELLYQLGVMGVGSARLLFRAAWVAFCELANFLLILRRIAWKKRVLRISSFRFPAPPATSMTRSNCDYSWNVEMLRRRGETVRVRVPKSCELSLTPADGRLSFSAFFDPPWESFGNY